MKNRYEYAPEWSDVIRPAILRRDGYKCKHCGVAHRAIVYRDSKGKYIECDEFMKNWAVSHGFKVFTLYLQVAHLNHDKSDNRPENLLSLCPSCHSRFDSHHKQLVRIAMKGQPHEQSCAEPKKKPKSQKNLTEKVREWIEENTNVTLGFSAIQDIISLIKNHR